MVKTTDTTYGQPNPNHYLLGRGELLIGAWSGSTPPSEYLSLGNVTAFALSTDQETIEHQSSIEGLKTTDAQAILEATLAGSFTCDEALNEEVQSLFLQATKVEASVGAQTNEAVTDPVPATDTLTGGKWYELSTTNGRVYGITAATIVATTGVTTAVENTDYKLNTSLGLLFVIVGGVLDGDTLHANTVVTTAAKTKTTVRALQETTKRVTMIFQGKNAYVTNNYMVRVHKAVVSAGGDMPLIGDDWAAMDFEFTVESDLTNHATSPYMDIEQLHD